MNPRVGDDIRVMKGRLKGEGGPVLTVNSGAIKFWNGERWRWVEMARFDQGDVEIACRAVSEEDRP